MISLTIADDHLLDPFVVGRCRVVQQHNDVADSGGKTECPELRPRGVGRAVDYAGARASR